MKVSAELLQKYDQPGPRYTSYPTAPNWRDDFGPDDHRASLARVGRRQTRRGLSLYVHIPFCEALCVYCGCSTVITKRLERGAPYVDRVLREAALVRAAMVAEDGVTPPVVQHHWGGGTPTFLPADELERLAAGLHALFPLARPGVDLGEGAEPAEVSIEVDPRVTSPDQLAALRRAGFQRISMGVQDFDPRVQQAIHRVQSFEQTRDLVLAARELGFTSVNLDLVYGLPLQQQATFAASVERALELAPDRVACYSYAHVPWLRKHQLAIRAEALPRGLDKLALYLVALEAFGAAGYEAIGMDHFARGGDGLARAAAAGRLHRNFQGYTTQPAEDLIGLGMSAIGEVDGAFAQNHKELADYEAAVDAGVLPTHRGLRRSAEDDARRRIILDLMCRFRVDFAEHGGSGWFTTTYERALAALAPMLDDGLVRIDDHSIEVSELGRMFVRNVCMPFDAYLARPDGPDGGIHKPMFSQTV